MLEEGLMPQPINPINQPKNTELDLKHELEQLELKHKQQQQQQQKKQKSGTAVLAELFIFAILLTVFPYIVRMISRLWIEASRNYVRIIILSFSLACSKPSTEKSKMPET
jgi:heme/copper-type cytochrome/quinol oxidase subunit 3